MELAPFDIRGPLPTGTTLLEASAGTGKTWTIAALVARFVAEGHARLEELLVVTFGRAASQELRERVRAQLVEAERVLADPTAPRPDSDLLDLLLDAPAEELVARRRRLREALAGFDAATIATIHQFCQQVLRSLGVAGDSDAGATLVEDLDQLVVEVVDDLYLRAFAHADQKPDLTRAQALALGRGAVADPRAGLEPADADPASPEGRRVGFAQAVRAEFAVRKRRLGLLGYDDLLGQLADALAGEAGGERSDRRPCPDGAVSPAAARMRARWKVVLVDEFQDTDPVQWQVFDRAFTGAATMVLIGDPKQAIYAFRGGDVVTYLAAADTAATRQTLAVNHRSDEVLVGRIQALMSGAALGDPRIEVHRVTAAHAGSRLAGAGDPFRLRVIRPTELGRSERQTKLGVDHYRQHLWTDVARDIKRLLTSGATFAGVPLEPKDVAVIAHAHRHLAEIQQALAAVGVPAVVAGNGSVFATPAAAEWLTLLEALEQPHRTARVRAAALTAFLGVDVTALAAAGDELTDTIAEQVRDWADLVTGRGVAAVLEAAVAGGLVARVLGRVGGERLLTDLRHVGQVLHQVAADERLALVALTGWLREQVADAVDGRPEAVGERTRRLDSDAAAVQLVTIHGSKGLQYPVVYLPTLWDRYLRDPEVALFHDDSGARRRNVGGAGSAWRAHVARHKDEDAGEALRLLYVALTRAQSQVVAWYCPASRNAPDSGLHRMLLGRRPGAALVPGQHPVEEPAALVAKLDWHAANGGPAWEPAVWAEVPADELPRDEHPLSVRSFERGIDTAWRRTSYSALTAVEAAQPHPSLSEPEVEPKDDEPEAPLGAVERTFDQAGTRSGDDVDQTFVQRERDPLAVLSPMAELPVGATFGSLVHAVLEHADPAAPERDGDLRAELLHHIGEELVRWPVDLDPDVLADALVAVCDSPLGPLAGEATLRGIGRADRLCELDFELPLAGGDGPRRSNREATLADLAPLLEKHLSEGDPVRGYTVALADPVLGGQPLRGYLTGSIDVVLRLPDPAGGTRFLTVDYKTNWLGTPGETLSASAYAPAALDAAMGHSDYPLQALLYVVVLHRFLRWRLAGYDPEQHLAGVLYLYLRGMCGPETPRVEGAPCGVFAWRPPVVLVEAISALLDGEVR